MTRSALVLALLFLADTALAATPLQFAAPNVQAPRDSTVNGARFSMIHGRTETVKGVDLGFLGQ